jgi:hypothetical protein
VILVRKYVFLFLFNMLDMLADLIKFKLHASKQVIELLHKQQTLELELELCSPT